MPQELDFARLKRDGELLPWWQQPRGFREGKIEGPPKTFINSIEEFKDKVDSTGYILVTKNVLKEVIDNLMNIERISEFKDEVEYLVLDHNEKYCYIEFLT